MDPPGDVKANHAAIDDHRFNQGKQLLVYDEIKTVHFYYKIVFSRLIQSHGEAWRASAVAIAENAYGGKRSVLKIMRKVLQRGFGYF